MDYTAIYNTLRMKGVKYAFKASEDKEAIEFCEKKFNVKNIFLLNNNTGESIHLGDPKVTHEIARGFFRKEGLPYED